MEQKSQNKKYDLLALGELLVDLIGHEICEDLSQARDFHRYQGGSPANLAGNMAKLGKTSAIVSAVGNDNFGKYLKIRVEETGVDSQFIQTIKNTPTSIVVNTRTLNTPDFIAYREADRFIKEGLIKDELLKNTRIFHTTCFGLSKKPAQISIINAAKRAYQLGCQLSIDLNYAPQIWGNRKEAHQIIRQYCQLEPFVKLSEDDYERLFDYALGQAENAFTYFHQAGAKLVCLTLGKKGSMISHKDYPKPFFIPVIPLESPGDATGAGDAYWAGFLTAWLESLPIEKCGLAGARLAAKKMQSFGPLPKNIDKKTLFEF